MQSRISSGPETIGDLLGMPGVEAIDLESELIKSRETPGGGCELSVRVVDP
jgi:hypothetical protein